MPKQKNPWAKINKKPPKYQIGDIVYTYMTLGDRYINVLARNLPKKAIVQLSKVAVIGYKMRPSTPDTIHGTPPKWLPLYVVRTLEIYIDLANIEKLDEEHSVNRWWVEQGDDAYRKVFNKSPKHNAEFVFR